MRRFPAITPGQPPPGTMPCQVSPPPMPCCTCGGGSFEPPPLLLGGGDDTTGSVAGWLTAGLLPFFLV
jgi:hypothetical protein